MSDEGDFTLVWEASDAPSGRPPLPAPTFDVEPLIAFLRARVAEDEPEPGTAVRPESLQPESLPPGVVPLFGTRRPKTSHPKRLVVETFVTCARLDPQDPVVGQAQRALAALATHGYNTHPDFRPEWGQVEQER